jgi:hypothetical protein
VRGALTLLAAVAVVHLVLIQPNHPGAATWGAFRMVPLELPVVLLLLLAAPPAARGVVRVAVAAFLVVMPVVKLADYAAFLAYNRGFNPVLDGHLLPSAWALGRGAVGAPLAAAAVAGALLAVGGLAALVWWATGRIAAAAPGPGPLRRGLAIAAVPAVAIAATDVVRPAAFDPPGAAFTLRLAGEHAAKVAATRADLARFAEEAATDGLAALPPEAVLAGLAGRDVLVLFVESYGRAALDNPRYAPSILARLEGVEAAFAAEGLAMRSGWLVSPTVGGQSWLAHATLLAGLEIDSQPRYQALLASPRRTLLHAAQGAGWETVALAPAITLAWPEAGYFGYDRVLAAADLGYAGLPFNWVTMPDQYTLRALERMVLEGEDRAPVFVMAALISSHAPWTPVPEPVDWEAIGDGRIFDAMAVEGDPPAVVWRDEDRVREQYRRSIDYVLEIVAQFVLRHAEDPPLVVVLGDHEPAAFVSETTAGTDVPAHMIGRPGDLAAIEGWGWSPGLVPAADAPRWPMAAFRDRFIAAYTPEASRAEGGAVRQDGPLPLAGAD